VEAHLAAAIGAGLNEAEFWDSTPYQADLRLMAVGKVRQQTAMLTGWFAERFAREDKLQGPQAYVKQFFQPPNEAEAEAQAEAMFHRMAQDWGLEVEPYSE